MNVFAEERTGAPDPRPGDEVVEVLVVCTGNIARSPLAMAMLEDGARRALGADAPVWVRSSGVHGLSGEPAVAASRDEASSRGLDLSHHRATVTDADDVRRCDLVLTMTESQRAKVTRLAPAAGRFTFTLREFARLIDTVDPAPADLSPRERVRWLADHAHRARPVAARPDGREDVEDPYGGPRDGYRTVAEELDVLVSRVAPRLFGGVGEGAADGAAR